MDQLMDIATVSRVADLSPATIRRLEAAGLFPHRRRVAPGRVAWLATDVETWLTSRPIAAGTAPSLRAALGCPGSIPSLDGREVVTMNRPVCRDRDEVQVVETARDERVAAGKAGEAGESTVRTV